MSMAPFFRRTFRRTFGASLGAPFGALLAQPNKTGQSKNSQKPIFSGVFERRRAGCAIPPPKGGGMAQPPHHPRSRFKAHLLAHLSAHFWRKSLGSAHFQRSLLAHLLAQTPTRILRCSAELSG